MTNLVTEIYQQYKEIGIRTGTPPDIAIETLWITNAIENQPFKASIDIYIILRHIDRDEKIIRRTLESLESLIRATFEYGKYEYQICKVTDLWRVFEAITTKHCRAIVKEDRIENLQIQYFPACYTYDKYSLNYCDLSRLISILISHPGCAVSFQLIPTYYNSAERSVLDQITQDVNTLSKGVNNGNCQHCSSR